MIVRLTDAQRGALRVLASMAYDGGDESGLSSRALKGALDALDESLPPFTAAEYGALCGAAAREDEEDGEQEPGDPGYANVQRARKARDRALQKVRRLR